MKIVDTHAHLYGERYSNDLSEVVARAQNHGVDRILLPNIDESSINDLKSSVAQYPGYLIPMMGLHPTSVSKAWKAQLDVIRQELESARYIAVGEIGIDLYWDLSLKEEQTAVFEEQLKWSAELNLPVVIHSRNAIPEAVASIRKIGKESLRGVFHSFGGTVNELQSILELKNFMVGINGMVTFKKSDLGDVLLHCQLENIVLETDSPYISPVPYRGKRNESAYLTEVLKKISEVYQTSPQEVALITSQNSNRLFGIESYLNCFSDS